MRIIRFIVVALLGYILLVAGGLGLTTISSSLGRFYEPILVTAIAFYSLLILAGIFWSFQPKKGETTEQQILRLEKEGLLTTETFEATRAFGVDELEDEGLHYFVELKDGRILFLSGQYLYDYEPDEEQARRFPCSAFSIRRHKNAGYVVEIHCEGRMLEPEFVAAAFTPNEIETGVYRQDGQVIAEMTYDQLKDKMRARGRLTSA